MNSAGEVAGVALFLFLGLTATWWFDPGLWVFLVFAMVALLVGVPLLEWAGSGRHGDGTFAPRWQTFALFLVVAGVLAYVLITQIDNLIAFATRVLTVGVVEATVIDFMLVVFASAEFYKYVV